jgi:DNA-binding response OmpR family regulator
MKSKRILIVDDEPVVIQVLSRFFQSKECLVSSAGCAEDAIFLLREDHFDLIMLDVNLPGASGFSAIKALKSMSDAVILVMSGLADEEIRKDALTLGADELIAKPFEHQQLLSLIQALLVKRDLSAA